MALRSFKIEGPFDILDMRYPDQLAARVPAETPPIELATPAFPAKLCSG
jgi:hypothetical protein